MYVTANEVCEFLGYDSADSATLARVNAMIPVVEGICDSFIGTTLHFENDTTKDYLVGETGIVYLNKHLVSYSAVKQIYSDGTLSDPINSLAVKALPFGKPPYRMLQIYSKTATGVNVADSRLVGVGEVRVTGDWGFQIIPEDVKYALALAVKYHSDYFSLNPFVTSDGTGLSTVDFKDTDKVVNLQLPNMSKAILSRYKISRLTND